MIVAENLEKKFEDFVAVNSINFTVSTGEVMALLGPNGAGKTTTIRMLTSILAPTQGRASVNGYDVIDQPKKVRESVGVLTENHGLYNRMPADEYLDFFGQVYGLDSKIRTERIEELFSQFGLSNAASQRVGEYSKGMRQKLALARSLLHDPPVLLLDEPTSAMDPESARLVRNMIKDMQTNERTILICTHNLSEAEELADKIAIIQNGSIIEIGTPAELRQKLLGPPRYEIRFTEGDFQLDDSIHQLVNVIEENSFGFIYSCEVPEEINPQLIHILINQGKKIVYVREVRRSLENIYMHAMNNGNSKWL